jgi:hypothetical protein
MFSAEKNLFEGDIRVGDIRKPVHSCISFSISPSPHLPLSGILGWRNGVLHSTRHQYQSEMLARNMNVNTRRTKGLISLSFLTFAIFCGMFNATIKKAVALGRRGKERGTRYRLLEPHRATMGLYRHPIL